MGNPLTTNKPGGICFAFPDVCLTPAPPGPDVPVPYPNTGKLEEAESVSEDVFAGRNKVVRRNSSIKKTSGDEAGTSGGVTSGSTRGEVKFVSSSATVLVNGQGAVRMFDTTNQNNGNAVGTVLAGVPTVLVGG